MVVHTRVYTTERVVNSNVLRRAIFLGDTAHLIHTKWGLIMMPSVRSHSIRSAEKRERTN